MIGNLWERMQSWYDHKVETTAVRRLSGSVNGRAVKNAIPPTIVFIIISAVLISHLSTLKWPESFSGFLLASPAVAILLLSIFYMVACPTLMKNVPLYACGGYVGLVAVQSILGALAMSLPAFVSNTGNPSHRMVFSAVTILVLTLIVYNLSKSFVSRTVNSYSKQQEEKLDEPETESNYVSSCSDTDE